MGEAGPKVQLATFCLPIAPSPPTPSHTGKSPLHTPVDTAVLSSNSPSPPTPLAHPLVHSGRCHSHPWEEVRTQELKC